MSKESNASGTIADIQGVTRTEQGYVISMANGIPSRFFPNNTHLALALDQNFDTPAAPDAPTVLEVDPEKSVVSKISGAISKAMSDAMLKSVQAYELETSQVEWQRRWDQHEPSRKQLSRYIADGLVDQLLMDWASGSDEKECSQQQEATAQEIGRQELADPTPREDPS